MKTEITQERIIRLSTISAVLLVALIAAVVSFIHIAHLALTHGQLPLAAYLLPISIDGTVMAASMVMLRNAQIGKKAPIIAQTMLSLAVLATLAANVAYGIPFGTVSAIISGWPAVAFIGSVEMFITDIRHTNRRTEKATEKTTTAKAVVTQSRKPASSNGSSPALRGRLASKTHLAEKKYKNDLRDGNVPSINRLKSDMNMGTPGATRLHKHLALIASQSATAPVVEMVNA